MEISYWKSRWRKGHTGWHMDQVYPFLKQHLAHLNLEDGATILVPLCGKSLDLDWLAARGYHLVGVDISDKALRQVISRRDESFKQTRRGPHTCYRSASTELWCADILKVNQKNLPPIDAVYDKAAIIALPPEHRRKYAAHLQSLLKPHTQLLMNTFEYEQNEMNGPPFAVFEEELQLLFGSRLTITLLKEHSIFDDLKNFQHRGLASYLQEKLYLMQPVE